MDNNKLDFITARAQREEEQKKQSKRRKIAKYLLSSYDQGSSWLIIENLKLLYQYSDIEEVQRAVTKLLETSKDTEVKAACEDFFKQELDISALLEQQEEIRRTQIQARQAREEFISRVKSGTRSNNNNTLGQLNLLNSLYQYQ